MSRRSHLGHDDLKAPRRAATVYISVIMPCLNEAESVADCVKEARSTLNRHGWSGEVVVVDNLSSDASALVASAAGARVVRVEQRGYGSAIRGGANAARGEILVIGDADGSYDFGEIAPMVDAIDRGADLVVGSRFKGRIIPGAMPWLNRWVGNPLLTSLGRLLFRVPITDFHCGLRAVQAHKFSRLGLITTGMEFATEMIVRARRAGLRIEEVPVTLRPDGRGHPSHLRPWRDGWRHLRFMALLAPTWTLILPGLVMLLCGILLGSLVLLGPIQINATTLGVHTLICSGAASIVGLQTLHLGIVMRFGAGHRPQPDSIIDRLIRGATRLDTCGVAGCMVVLVGLLLIGLVLVRWAGQDFGSLPMEETLPFVVVGASLLCMGVQLIFTGLCSDMFRERLRVGEEPPASREFTVEQGEECPGSS